MTFRLWVQLFLAVLIIGVSLYIGSARKKC